MAVHAGGLAGSCYQRLHQSHLRRLVQPNPWGDTLHTLSLLESDLRSDVCCLIADDSVCFQTFAIRDLDEQREQINGICVLFILVAVISFFSQFLQVCIRVCNIIKSFRLSLLFYHTLSPPPWPLTLDTESKYPQPFVGSVCFKTLHPTPLSLQASGHPISKHERAKRRVTAKWEGQRMRDSAIAYTSFC